jgi:hypothetical protein
MGMNAKDVSDGVCGAVSRCLQDFSDHAQYVWEDDLPTVDEIMAEAAKNTRAKPALSNEIRDRILGKVRASIGYTVRN